MLLAACGSSKRAATTSSDTKAGATTTVAGAPNPNAPEQLPPGKIPDDQVFVTYTSATGGSSVSYPQGWARRDSATGTTFSQFFNSVDLATTTAASAPTISSARSSATATLKSLPGFKLSSASPASTIPTADPCGSPARRSHAVPKLIARGCARGTSEFCGRAAI